MCVLNFLRTELYRIVSLVVLSKYLNVTFQYETFDDQNIYPQHFTVSVIMWYIIHVYDKYDIYCMIIRIIKGLCDHTEIITS